jgi:hypothetical protein
VIGISSNSSEYSYANNKIGTCLLFNNQKFKKKNQKERAGSEIDVVDLKNCFETFGFNVKLFIDKKSSEIIKELKDASSSNDNYESDCLVCVLMSHGDLENLCAYDRDYKTKDVFSIFNGENCPSLSGKPKLFFVQVKLFYL